MKKRISRYLYWKVISLTLVEGETVEVGLIRESSEDEMETFRYHCQLHQAPLLGEQVRMTLDPVAEKDSEV